MNFTISMIPLGFYFDRHRNLAYGITSSGTGFGIMVLAPITNALIERYTWRGACFIFAGLIIHYYAVALIIDPITYDEPVRDNSSSRDSSSQLKEKESHQNCTSLKLELNERDDIALYHSLQNLETKDKALIEDKREPVFQRNKIHAFSELNINNAKRSETVRHMFDDVLSNMSSDMINRSHLSLKITKNMHERERTDDQQISIQKKESSTISALRDATLIFTNIKYDLFCCNIILVCSVISTIYNHLPAYSCAMGNTETQVSLLISVIGISNISSRFFTGLITSTKCHSILFYINLLSALSVVFLFAPIYGTYYAGHVVVAMAAGGCNSFIVIMSPFVIKFVGLESLDIGFGVLLFMAGIGFSLGPPLSGMIRLLDTYS